MGKHVRLEIGLFELDRLGISRFRICSLQCHPTRTLLGRFRFLTFLNERILIRVRQIIAIARVEIERTGLNFLWLCGLGGWLGFRQRAGDDVCQPIAKASRCSVNRRVRTVDLEMCDEQWLLLVLTEVFQVRLYPRERAVAEIVVAYLPG